MCFKLYNEIVSLGLRARLHHPSDWRQSINEDIWTLCSAVRIKEKIFCLKHFFSSCSRQLNIHYEQWGELWGIFQMEGLPELLLNLCGCRHHFCGSVLSCYCMILCDNFVCIFYFFSLPCTYVPVPN